jgi:hypothetical protein
MPLAILHPFKLFCIWYGMVWYGMVWYGMVWYGMVWYGMVWYGMVWYGMVWYGMVLGEFDLPLIKQQIKYLIGLSDNKAKSFLFLFTKGTGYCLLAFNLFQALSYFLHLLSQSNLHKRPSFGNSS